MKRFLVAVTLFALLALGVFKFWPGDTIPGSSVVDAIGRILDKPDTAAYRALERNRVTFDSAWRVRAVQVQAMQDAYRDSLATATARQQAAEARTVRVKARADSLTRALTTIRDDDDSLPALVQLVAAKDSVITAVTAERDVAFVHIRLLTQHIAEQDSALVMYRTTLTEAIRQRDEYRKFTGRPNLLRAGAVLLATVAICRSLSEPC